MRIPFIDLSRQFNFLNIDYNELFRTTIEKSTFIRGRAVREFEDAFGSIFNMIVINTASGTDALFVALKSLGIESGDEVLTPAFSWISSAEIISLCKATPVFVDVNDHTYTIDPNLIEQKITAKTKAIVVVHLYGQAANVEEIAALCEKHNIFLVEDCAQSHLTQYHGRYVGTFGEAGAFSFYPTKNLGAYGDAGCVLTKNELLATKLRRFANHGALYKEDHITEGMNSRMDSIQASILLRKLPFLQQWNEKRIHNAMLYNRLLALVSEVTIPVILPGTVHTFHIYAIRAKKRDALKQFLLDSGIQTLIHYPIALPNLPAYKYFDHQPRDFPVSTLLQEEILSLPIFPELTEKEISYICEKIKAFYRK